MDAPTGAWARAWAATCCLLVLCTRTASIHIKSIFPEQGGTAGGTRLTIFGSGFSGDSYTGQNVVHLGPHACEVLDYYSTAYMITCLTPAVETDNSLPVQVVAGGVAAQHCCFTYAEWASPAVEGISPRSARPGQELLLWGPHHGLFESWDASKAVGAISLGSQYCLLDPEGGEDTMRREGDRFYLACLLPSPDSSVDIEVGQAGNYNLTVEFAPTSEWAGGGYAAVKNRVADASGVAFDLQVHPVVETLLPSAGSQAGGTPVTLTGSGFPTGGKRNDSIDAAAGIVDIRLPGGSRCILQTSNGTHLTCLTEPMASPQPTSTGAASTVEDDIGPDGSLGNAFESMYPGGRGLQYAVWFNQSNPGRDGLSDTIGWEFSSANDTELVESDFHAPRHPQDDYFVDTLRTFFIPPVNGAYEFWVNSDDDAVLWAAYKNSSTGNTETVLLVSTDYSPYGDWWKKDTQRSPQVRLEAGQPVLLHAARYENKGSEHLQVAVTMPTSIPRLDATPEIQHIALMAEMHGMQQAVRLHYPTPVASVYRIDFTSEDPQALDSLALTVRISFSPQLATNVPLAATPDVLSREMSALLAVNVHVEASCMPAEGRASWTITVSPSTQVHMAPAVVVHLATDSVPGTPSKTPPRSTVPPSTMEVLPTTAPPLSASPTPGKTTETPEVAIPTMSPPNAATIKGEDTGGGGGGTRRRRLQQADAGKSGDGADFVNEVGWCGSGGLVGAVPSAVTATVSTVEAGVGLPAAAFEVFPLAMPGMFVLLSAGDSTEDVKDKVEELLAELSSEQLGNLELSVIARPASELLEGLPGMEYLIEFPMLPAETAFSLPQLGARLAPVVRLGTVDGQPQLSAAAGAAVVAEQTDAFGGAVQMSAPFTSRSATIPISSSALQVKTLMRDLAGVSCKHVNVWGDLGEGELHWELVLDPLDHFGDMPQMVLDATGLAGTNAQATIETWQDGAKTWSSRPIAGDFLRQPISEPNNMEVWVGGALGVCEASGGSGCVWTYLEELTPRLASASPIQGKAGEMVSLTGSGFGAKPELNSVSIGGAECRVTSASETALECEVQEGAGTAGSHPVQLTVAGAGLAAQPRGAPVEFTLSVLDVRGISPQVISVSGGSATILKIVGTGFDGAQCNKNIVTLGGTACEVVPPCEVNRLSCVMTVTAALPKPLQLVVEVAAEAGQGERVAVADAVEVVEEADGQAPAILAVQPAELPSAGGTLELQLGGNLRADGIASIHLLLLADAKAMAFSLATHEEDAFECIAHADITELTKLSCTVGRLPPGTFRLLVTTTSGTQLVAESVLTVVLRVDGVHPTSGSMAGGTPLTISGAGFSREAGENAVFLRVPVSTTFPAGLLPCDVTSAAENHVICTTRPHCSGNAKAFLPGSCELQPTEAGEVVVTLCNAGLSDTACLRCLLGAGGRQPGPRASCAGSAPCSFAYTDAATARVHTIDPEVITQLPAAITLFGSGLAGATGVTVGGQPCEVSSISAEQLICAAPPLSAGRYRVAFRDATGSVGWVEAGLSYVPSIATLSATHLSVAGGASLTLSTTGAPWFTAGKGGAPDIDVDRAVRVGGLPCEITAVEQTSLTCTPSSVLGRLKVEFYEAGSWAEDGLDAAPAALPAPLHSSSTVFKDHLALDWGWGAPAEGVPSDGFLADLHGWLLAPENGTYAFELEAADVAGRLWLDHMLVLDGAPGTEQTGSDPAGSVALSAGFHHIRLQALEDRGKAGIALHWALPSSMVTGNASLAAPVPASSLFALRPGQPATVQAEVAGLHAIPGCPVSSHDVQAYRGLAQEEAVPIIAAALHGSTTENTLLETEGNHCAVLLSTFATPILLEAAVVDGGAVEGGGHLHVIGYGLQSPDVQADISIPTPSVNVGASGDDQEDAAFVAACELLDTAELSTTSDSGQDHLLCALPQLAAGAYELSVSRRDAGRSINALTLEYTAQITELSATRGSLYGGTQLTVAGANFGSLFSGAVKVGRVACQLDPAASNGTQLVCTTACCATDGANQWGPASVSLPSGAAAMLEEPLFALHSDYTPEIRGVTYAGDSLPYAAPFQVTIELRLPDAFAYPKTGAAEDSEFLRKLTGEIQVEVHGQAMQETCANLTVASLQADPHPPVATLTCEMAPLPGGDYTVRSTLDGFGHSSNATLSLPISVTGMQPTASSLAGGLPITVSGYGFATSAGAVAVIVGNVTAEVLSAGATELVFAMPALDEEGSWEVSLRTSPQAVLAPVGNVSTSASLTPVLEGMQPLRGSSAGGTPVTLALSNMPKGAAKVEVLFGGSPCTDVAVNPDGDGGATVTCRSPPPAAGNTREVGVPVRVLLPGAGFALGELVYGYVDAWSAGSTWGGGLPPFEGDSVVVPANTTILLDVSPPRLGALVLEGTLQLDPEASELRLDADYIIIAGGALLAGTEEVPHPGHITITLHGGPKSRELPVYGAKCIALRSGRLALFGQRKRPSWAQLGRTVHPGDTQLMLDTSVEGWEVGDKVVISSSSFFAAEVDVALIESIAADGAGRALLSLDRPLAYTHLGETELVPSGGGEVRMAAEVAVLSRRLVLQGDATSAVNRYGAQVMIHGPAEASPHAQMQLADVEVRAAGQASRLGRYPLHFHMHGDATGSYVSHCAIHSTFNRALTLHGSHNVAVTGNVAYDTAGHAFFVEDGVETGNVLEGNLGIWTRRAHSLLATDTTPATFWVTNPNNTLIGNVAAGSEAYGFWYRMLDHPEGASFTLDVCPKFTALAVFLNNVAHSNLLYGLRVFPEFYPNSRPCDPGKGNHVLAEFRGLLSYKNGMKGAIATQVGLVQFQNFTVADCGGGPFAHKVNGKDHGGGIEFTWIIDGRNRSTTEVDEMAGVVGALIIARTQLTQRQAANGIGTAAQWPSARGVRGLIAQSLPQGTHRSSAFMQVTDVAWVGFAPEVGPQFVALEHCGKCKTFQGGQTAFVRGARFLDSGDNTALARWSWPHQGIFLDMDGSLLGGPPRQTLHAGRNGLLAAEPLCQDLGDNGWVCAPELVFRRTMLNGHKPKALAFRTLLVTLADGRATSRVEFTKYNDNGYQWTVPVGRNYMLHWDSPERVDPEGFILHESEEMGLADFLLYSTRHTQLWHHFKVNDLASVETALPRPPTALPHGASAYEHLLRANPVDGGREDTAHTIYVAGTENSRLKVKPSMCPVEGCPPDGLIPEPQLDYRQGRLLWSDASTWSEAGVDFPDQDGIDVVIPAGWDVVLDTNTPRLNRLTIAGNLTFGRMDLELHAVAVAVGWGGRLQAGSADEPHSHAARIVLHGNKDSPTLAVNNEVVPGAKVLTAFEGGSIELHGTPHVRRWTRLAATADAGATTLELQDAVDWQPGSRLVITSSSYNPDQAEVAIIEEVLADGRVLLLSAALAHEHAVLSSRSWPGGPMLGAEVGLLDSNVVIESADGEYQAAEPAGAADPRQGQKFGAYVLVHGDNSSLRLSEVSFRSCGQHGVRDGNACIRILAGALAPGSHVRACALESALAGGLAVEAGSSGLEAADNVLFGMHDAHGMHFASGGSVVRANLVAGTTKVMEGKSSFDKDLPSSFSITAPGNVLVGNVAAGSHRIGFRVVGSPLGMEECRTGHGPEAATLFADNVAHASLVGLLLEGAPGASCTGALNFAAWRNWDFGVLAGLEGIATSVLLEGVTAVDNRHAGVLVLKRGRNAEDHEANILGGLIQGQSGGEGACGPCPSFKQSGEAGGEAGCHSRLSRVSYAGGPTYGLVSATFATQFTSGPEHKPWDGLMGYPTVLGRARVRGTTFADFYGVLDECGEGTFALTNLETAPDAFHPHEFESITLERVATGAGGLLKLHGSNPEWRHPADCGEAVFVAPDNVTAVPLNCDGPTHIIMKDLDGSLFGSLPGAAGGGSTLVGVSPIAGAGRPTYAQGTPVADGPCPFLDDAVSTPGYICVPGWTKSASGVAVSSQGVWGDPQLLVIESRDKDTEDRNFGPVLLESGGAVDLLTPCMDHGWCFGYTCQKRLSTYWATVAANQTFAVNTTGTPPRNMRLWFPYAASTSEVVLVVNYFEINRRYLWLDGVGRLSPSGSPPAVGDSQPHGAYAWRQGEGLLTVKLTGAGRVLEVRTEAVLSISAHLAIGLDEFFQDGFVENVAALLGIEASRFKVVQVVPGSVVVDIEVAEDPAVLDAPLPEVEIDTSLNVDAATQRGMWGDSAAAEAARKAYIVGAQAAGRQSNSGADLVGSGNVTTDGTTSTGGVALREVVARLNATVRSGAFSIAAGGELLAMTVTLRSGEQEDDLSTFSLSEYDVVSPGGRSHSTVVIVTVVAAVAVALLCVAAGSLLFMHRRRKQAPTGSRTPTMDPIAQHSDSGLLEAVTAALNSPEQRIRVKNGHDSDSSASPGPISTASDDYREDLTGKARRSPVPPPPLCVSDLAGSEVPQRQTLDGSDESRPLKSSSAQSPSGATLKRRTSSKKRVAAAAASDWPVDPILETGMSTTTAIRHRGSAVGSLVSRIDEFWFSEGDGGNTVHNVSGGDHEYSAPCDSFQPLQPLSQKQAPFPPPYSASARPRAAHSSPERHSELRGTGLQPESNPSRAANSLALSRNEDAPTAACIGSASDLRTDPSRYIAAEVRATQQRASTAAEDALAPLRGTKPRLGRSDPNTIALVTEDEVYDPSQGTDGRAIHLDKPPTPPMGISLSDTSSLTFRQPAYASELLADRAGGVDGRLGFAGPDDGMRGASHYTYAKQGETYAGAVVKPADAGHGGTAPPTAFQQSQLYDGHVSGQLQKRPALGPGWGGSRMDQPVRAEQDVAARAGSSGRLVQSQQPPLQERPPMDPEALMRGKSLNVAEELARRLVEELPESAARSVDSAPPDGDVAHLQRKQADFFEQRRTLEVVEAAKQEQLNREREQEAQRWLQRLARPHDELDDFADEVLPSP